MDKLKYIIPVVLLLLGACSSDESRDPLSWEEEAPSPVQFFVTVGAGEDGEYASDYFKEGDEIRIYCPVSYSSPSFKDDAEGTYIYTFGKEEGTADKWPYKFSPKEGTFGFDWRTLENTSIYYVFEAMYFPGNEYFENVPVDQNKKGVFEKADMLIAHHRQALEDRGDTVQLTFHHAFAMVRVKVKLPANANPTEGPFPENAIQEAYMRAMLTSYEVNYVQVIDNDGLRSVKAPDADERLDPETKNLRKDVYMKKVSVSEVKHEEDANGKSIPYQEYVFEGIVPAQNFLDQGRDFLYFEVMKNDGSNKPALFKYVPNTPSLTLKSSHVLNLELEITRDSQELVVLTAEIKPWGKAPNDMEIGPVTK